MRMIELVRMGIGLKASKMLVNLVRRTLLMTDNLALMRFSEVTLTALSLAGNMTSLHPD